MRDSEGDCFAFNTVPWTEELAEQHGEKIMCLPYTTTPFALAEAAQTTSFQNAVIAEDFRLDPRTIKSRFVSRTLFDPDY